MSGAEIFAPMGAFTLLVFAVWSWLGYTRISGYGRGEISDEYLRLGTGPAPKDAIVTVHHHFSNLFEVPLLFYLGCLALFLTGQVDRIAVSLAWAFVLLRVAHSIIVLFLGNNPKLRVAPYVLSTLAAFGLWLLLFRRVMGLGA